MLTPSTESFQGISVCSFFKGACGTQGYLDALQNMFHCFYTSVSVLNQEDSFLPV